MKTFILKISLTIIIGYFFYENVLTQLSIEKIIKELKSVELNLISYFFCLSIVNALLLSLRTQLILNHLGFNPSYINVFFVSFTRNFFSDLLPAKLGTLIYIFLIPKFLLADFKTAISAFVNLTFLDLFAVGFIILIFAFFLAVVTGYEINSFLYVLALILILISAIFCVHLGKIVKSLLRVLKIKPGSKLLDLIDFYGRLSEQKILIKLTFLAILQRFVKYFSYWILFLSIVNLYGITSAKAHFLNTVFGFITAELFVSLPVFTIGGIGSFHTGWTLAFNLLGFDKSLAVSTAVTHHLITQSWGALQGILGVICLVFLSNYFNQRQVLAKAPFFSIIFISFFVIFFVTFKIFAEQREISTNSKNLKIVCSDCNYLFDGIIENQTTGIYKIEYGNIVKVYDSQEWFEQNPVYDKFLDRIIFTQTRSLSRYAPGRIVQMKNGELKVLVENGVFGTPTSEGSIIFERDRKSILLLSDEGEKVLFPLVDIPGLEISKPRISENGKYLAFIANQPKKWHVWVYDLFKKEVISKFPGCEPWFETDDQIVYIHVTGGKRYIKRFLISDKTSQNLIDPFDGYLSFYFPITNNKKLAFSASKDSSAGLERGKFDLYEYEFESKQIRPVLKSNTLIRWAYPTN